ncbi:MAG: SDR family oxidoreductase [Phycisphaeraceae bacterium]|nr:SDR family oxidoreductase [Phycisphaeraceae bacterium]
MTHDSHLPLGSRVAIVTGASSGIGLAIAERLVALGCRTVINARRAELLREVAARLDNQSLARAPIPRVLPVHGDAAEQDVIDRLFVAAESPETGASCGFGAPVDLVVINAGRGLSGSVATSDPSQWEEMVRTNLLGAARLMRTAAERLLAFAPIPEGESGMSGPWLGRPRDIVLIGSTVGRNISPFSSMYGGTKFALHSLAEAMRREIGPKGVRVSLIEPAVVESGFQAVAGYDPQNFGAFMRRIGPVLQPADVARAVEFVVSQPAHVHVADLLVRPTRQDYP